VRDLLAAGAPVTDRLSHVLPSAADLAGGASGVLAVEIGAGSGDFVAWFRPETLREVTWGGNPYESKVAEGATGPRLSPRRSFARWSEIVRGTSAPWREHEVVAARGLADHLAEAAANRAREDSRLAATLQRTLLIDELPKVPGVALAARYLPSTDDVVGGDWYDLVPLPDGRLSIVLGDVAGHGLAAAAVTAQIRHALRAHLLRDRGPAAALQGINDVVAALLPGELATAVLVELDPATGEVAIASAGHLPALRLAGGAAELVTEGRGPALGVIDDAVYAEARFVLGPADRLLLYSDGLVERRRSNLAEGLESLRTVATAARTEPHQLLDDVLTALNPPDDDDVTLLAVGRT
jgi:serine phosphatase RsbU (regulator of sigma subunit)